jgi:hypothetical protein
MNNKVHNALKKVVLTILMSVVFYVLFAGLVLVAECLANMI